VALRHPLSAVCERSVVRRYSVWPKYNEEMSESKARATITFVGQARRTLEIGESVRLHVADGTWQHGIRCISAPIIEDGERRVWIATEEE
jgi:DNA-binding IclR family transcriptional regulator